MSLLNPGMLGWLLPLVALPLVIHILSKGFPRIFEFPSISLIRETLAQRSRLHRWRHWILLLLRTAFLALLLLAFLEPVIRKFGADPAQKGGRHVLIVLDHSMSMEHHGSGPRPRERAVQEALKLIDSLAPEDEFNVLLMDAAPSTCSVGWTRDAGVARQFLARLKPGFSRGDVNLANAAAARLVNKSVAHPEVCYISDFQRRNWANADFTMLPPEAKLFFVNVGAEHRDNHAILEARLSQTQVLAGETVVCEASVGNYSAKEFRGRLTVTVDKRYTFEQDLAIPPWSESKTTVPVGVGGPGVHLCEVRLPDDALEFDNRFGLALTVQQKEEVLIVTDGPMDAHGGTYFLKMALNPFDHEAGSLLPRVITSKELNANRVAGVRNIFITQASRFDESACADLARFVFQGGGLLYFLDGPVDGENLLRIERATSQQILPLKLARRHTATNVVSGAQQLVRGDFKSRYLKLFQGAARQNLSLLEFYDYYQASATGVGSVLLSFGDGSPALGAAEHGQGTMLLLNFSPSELSSNLARQRVFPAWMQELIKVMDSKEAARAAYTIGETLHTEVWRNELRDLDFLSPSGAAITVKRELTGERYRVSFKPEQLGFYTLGSPKPLYAFGVNASPEESDLRPIDLDVLPKEFAADRAAHFVAGAEDFEALRKGKPVFHWFVLAAILLLVSESGFQLLLKRRVA
jgi:hypothetical protein